MGRLQWGLGGVDSAAALVVGGIAIALGGAALFGMVAHTWTPFLPQRGAAASPFHSVARAAPVAPSTELIPRRKRSFSIPFDPRPDEFPVAEAAPAVAPTLAALVIPADLAIVPSDSLPPGEYAVYPEEVAQRASALVPIPPIARAEAPPAETQVAEAPFFEPRAVVIRVADVKVAGSAGGRAMATGVRVVELPPPEAKMAKAKPVEPRRAEPKPVEPKVVEPKVVEPKVVEAKRPEPKPAPTKIAEARRPEPKPAPQKIAEAKRPEPRPAPQKVAEAKRVEPRPAPQKLAEARRPEARPVAAKVAEKAEPKRIEPRTIPVRAVGMKTADSRSAGFKRVADTRAQARLAEIKRETEARAEAAKLAEAKLAETKRAAEMREAELKLAEVRRAAEVKALEVKLAESQRAFEMQAAEARLAETRRSVETTLAEAKAAEAKLAETKRAVDMALALTKPAAATRAVDARPVSPRYDRCESCGTVTAVLRYRERGSYGWEVRVDFGSGGDRTFDYTSDPGLSIGERVRYEGGRVTRLYPRRAAGYSPT
jgi:hypothetical protein